VATTVAARKQDSADDGAPFLVFFGYLGAIAVATATYDCLTYTHAHRTIPLDFFYVGFLRAGTHNQ